MNNDISVSQKTQIPLNFCKLYWENAIDTIDFIRVWINNTTPSSIYDDTFLYLRLSMQSRPSDASATVFSKLGDSDAGIFNRWVTHLCYEYNFWILKYSRLSNFQQNIIASILHRKRIILVADKNIHVSFRIKKFRFFFWRLWKNPEQLSIFRLKTRHHRQTRIRTITCRHSTGNYIFDNKLFSNFYCLKTILK